MTRLGSDQLVEAGTAVPMAARKNLRTASELAEV